MYCSFSHQSDAIALALRMERDIQSRKDLDQRSDGSVELLVRVGRHQREANERITRSDSRLSRMKSGIIGVEVLPISKPSLRKWSRQ